MSKSRPDAPVTKAGPAAKIDEAAPPPGRATRETIESIVIAFVLAFLFRTFEAEMFVIPTGSMAPTLQGRHKDVTCPKCGYAHRASASEEVDQNTGLRTGEAYEIVKATCPMCRYTQSVDPQADEGLKTYSFNGDRITVGKGLYEFTEPRRWEVVVFKFPAAAQVNYIKRLVGLPNETIRLLHGDVYGRGADQTAFEILRKPPDRLRAMLQLVYDNDYVVDEMTAAGWPLRWQPWGAGRREWTTSDGGRSYHTAGKSPQPAWIRYQNFTPTDDDWSALEAGKLPKTHLVRSRLITDHYAYNDRVMRERQREPRDSYSFGLNWVGDLALECEVEVESDKGQVLLDLVRAGRHHRAVIDVASGEASLAIEGLKDFQPTAATSIRGPGKYRLMFANCDRQLLLWVDDEVVAFDDEQNRATTFVPTGSDRPRVVDRRTDPGDLAPAQIGSAGAAVRVRQIRLYRDIYYIADAATDAPNWGNAIRENNLLPRTDRKDFAEFLAEPGRWQGGPDGNVFDGRRQAEFQMNADEFFMLGDNSPASKDSRLWEGGHVVDRKLLIGKALFIYWPHAWPTSYNFAIDRFGVEFRVPFYPNFKRMQLIR